MTAVKKSFCGLFAMVFLCICFGFTPNKNQRIIEPFSLLNTDGTFVSLDDYKHAKGLIVVFTCNHCPFAKLYPERLNALNKKYTPLGIPLIAVSSTDTLVFEDDAYLKMIEKAKQEHFNFPYLYDSRQSVARQFKADKTPHAFVIWRIRGQWVVKYNGAIDDNGGDPSLVNKPFVADAVDALLKGERIAFPETKSVGCQIHFRK